MTTPRIPPPTTSPHPSPPPPPPAPLDLLSSPHLTRISLPLPGLLLASTILSFSTGALLGSALGGRTASLRFVAENAHRKPKSEKGWYLYYKSKNYASMLGAIKEGTKNGLRICMIVDAFVLAQGAMDLGRGRVDALGTVSAALTVAGGWALIQRLSYGMAYRTLKKGLIFGVTFGVAQDVFRQLKGEGNLEYLKWVPPYLEGMVERRKEEERKAREAREVKERERRVVPLGELGGVRREEGGMEGKVE